MATRKASHTDQSQPSYEPHDGSDFSWILPENALPLLEFDPEPEAIIEPTKTQAAVDAPDAAVACFFPEIVDSMGATGRKIMELPSLEPLWEIERDGRRLALFFPGKGAALASCTLERVIAAGCRTIVACGAAGTIRPELEMAKQVVTVTSAIRDEGTSYHYLPPGRDVTADATVAEILSEVAIRRGVPHLRGRTWTTDAMFRETATRVARRRVEGCLAVEMEAAALLSVAIFRRIDFGQYLYAHDDLTGKTWRECDWEKAQETRSLLLDLAAEAALAVQDKRGLAV